MKGAILGLGNIALEGHLPGWSANKDLHIVAGIDLSLERCALFQKKLPQSSVFSSLKEARTAIPDLAFVDISVPPHLHFALAKEALENGLHVLCEKPLVLNPAHLAELKKIAQAKNLVLFTVHNWKFAPILKKMTEIAASGQLGAIEKLDWYVLRTGPSITTEKENWRLDPKASGGGIWVDHGWHATYLILDWFRRPVKRVKAQFENRLPDPLPVEDTVNVKLFFEMGMAEIFFTWASRLRKNAGRIEGSEKIIQLEDNYLELSSRHAHSNSEKFQFDEALSQGSHHSDWFSEVIQEFYKEISDAAERGKNLQMAESCLAVLCAVQNAAQQQKEVALV